MRSSFTVSKNMNSHSMNFPLFHVKFEFKGCQEPLLVLCMYTLNKYRWVTLDPPNLTAGKLNWKKSVFEIRLYHYRDLTHAAEKLTREGYLGVWDIARYFSLSDHLVEILSALTALHVVGWWLPKRSAISTLRPATVIKEASSSAMRFRQL